MLIIDRHGAAVLAFITRAYQRVGPYLDGKGTRDEALAALVERIARG